MKITVCIKQVPDVNAPIQIKDGQLIQDSNRKILNAYDASAVEAALVLQEDHGIDQVEVVLIGPEKAKETIRKALAMGADKGIHIITEEENSFDSFAYAQLLAGFFKDREYDYIFCGKQSQDTDSGLTGSMLAEFLGLPYTTNAVGLEMADGDLTAKRQGDSGQEIIELPSPGVVTCSNDMNDPRIPSLKGIMQSKRKPVDTISVTDLGVDLSEESTKTIINSYEEKPERKAGEKFEGEPEEIARKVAQLLDTEANVI
ncbi:electron transfer flavoprotein subunit beta/FixA family protein [Rhodohalobacter sulfatireducens]|uniref:Electron transfer flavoprotein subunit beta/FixA family protein n=1 Tax=Rhodohalobacter sulfatireducens TaxID=2911366 RepID=A0ABS9KH96_9BACT|nr:electron transfer flavoprotein subunit beta/FixA family protein [Rhodohalobacter sulfatireducens]MCG2590195.1 electron transfer flavoprotein subunit beta/FixA family protein [Rhodohalobacter sulfatireducens]